MDGRLGAVYATVADGETVMSPDHVRVVTPNPVQTVPAAVDPGRSRGLEGLAASRDGRFLYGMLEGPLWDVASKYWENQEGQQVLRVLDFSLAEQRWTGRHWKYVLSPGATAIGDFNMIDAAPRWSSSAIMAKVHRIAPTRLLHRLQTVFTILRSSSAW